MRLADLLVESALERGINQFFGVTGRGSLHLSDAIARSAESDFVPMLHEQSAGFAAMGFTGASGQPSVCLLSTGVGSTNALTPLVCAWQDQVPVIFISGQNFSDFASTLNPTSKRTYGEQELNLRPMVQGVVKKFVFVDNPGNFEENFQDALDALTEGRPGPIWVDVPLDFQSSKVVRRSSRSNRTLASKISPPHAMDTFAETVEKSKRPIILVGPSMIFHPEKSAVVEQLTDLALPVVFESGAESLFPASFTNSLGAIGTMGSSPAAIAALEAADAVIGLGALFRINITGNDVRVFAPNAKLFLFDYDSNEIPPPLATRCVSFDTSPTAALEKLGLIDGDHGEWMKACQEAKALTLSLAAHPTDLRLGVDLHELAELLPDSAEEDAIFVTDSGFCEVILPTNSRLGPHQKWVHPFSQGSMGFGTSGAIGASHAFPERQVILIIGDGSLMMNLQDLHTISSLKLRIKILVIDNDMYGIIRLRQESLFRGRTIGVDESTGLGAPDWQEIAKGFGLPFTEVSTDLISVESLSSALSSPGPSLSRIQGSLSQEYWVPSKALTMKTAQVGADSKSIFLQALDLQLEMARRIFASPGSEREREE